MAASDTVMNTLVYFTAAATFGGVALESPGRALEDYFPDLIPYPESLRQSRPRGVFGVLSCTSWRTDHLLADLLVTRESWPSSEPVSGFDSRR